MRDRVAAERGRTLHGEQVSDGFIAHATVSRFYIGAVVARSGRVPEWTLAGSGRMPERAR